MALPRRGAWLLVCGLAALAAALPAAAQDVAQPWGACGGLNGPTAKDEASVACPENYACIRQDECVRAGA
jgi:hypothetical protein